MASGFTTAFANSLLAHALKGTAYTQPTNLYLGLFTVAPTAAGGGTEVSGNAYARQTINSWSVPSAGASANAAQVTFPTPTGAWGTVVAYAIFDAVTAGNMLVFGTLTVSKTITTGDIVQSNISDITVTLASS